VKKTDIDRILSGFKSKNILIIGDVMLDSYLWGDVNRISPEAPVPVISSLKKEYRLGGAANVALNIKSLGANPVLCGIIGKDNNGAKFCERLKVQNISNIGIIISNQRETTSKTRIISDNQHLIRIDEENNELIHPELEQEFLNKILGIMEGKIFDAVVFEDYDKGAITLKLINEIVDFCNKNNIPVLVDPKKRNFHNYKNVTLFKPNLIELSEGLKCEIDKMDIKGIEEATKLLREKIQSENILVTLSDQGIFIGNKKHGKHILSEIMNITDVSGAGDTVLAVATLCLATGAKDIYLAEISNIAGGFVCGKVGVVPITNDELLNECLSRSES